MANITGRRFQQRILSAVKVAQQTSATQNESMLVCMSWSSHVT